MKAGSGMRESVSMLKELVKINSVNPFDGRGSGEAEISEFIRGRLRSYGAQARLQKVKGSRTNVIGIVKGSGGGKSLMLNGHMDTVGVTAETKNPFGATVDDKGQLHGRGACDMKGSIASMMGAIKTIADSGSELKGDLIFTGVIDEEYLSAGTNVVIKEYTSDAAIVGEPTSLGIAIAHKGYAWVGVDVHGRASHGSVPEKGIDAIAKASKLIGRLSELQKSYKSVSHPLLGNPKMHMSTIIGGTEWAVVPETCSLHLERRTLPAEPKNVAVKEVKKVVAELSAEDPEFNASVTSFFEQPGLDVSRKEPVVRALSSAYRSVMRHQPAIVGVPYWTDAALLVSEKGIPTCLFGPGDIRLAHSADEYVPIREVEKATLVFERTIQGFCGVKAR